MTKRKVAYFFSSDSSCPNSSQRRDSRRSGVGLATTLCYPESFDWGWEMMCSVTLEAGKDPQCAATTDDHFQV